MTVLSVLGNVTERRPRSKNDIEQRLDRLIEKIKEVQRPYMRGDGIGDVVLVSA